MILAHRAMLRDLDRVSRTAADLAERPGDGRVPHLTRYAGRICELIAHHHEGEDEILWPALHERGADAEALELLQTEHAELEARQARLVRAVAGLRGGADSARELEKAARATHELLGTHTADEERELVGRLAPHLDAALWKNFERGMVRSAPKWTLSFMPPWLASVAEPEERAGVPARPVARLMRGSLRRRHRAAFGDQPPGTERW
ncbi:hemerythrin domain-containing protein [Streptomyces sp. JJ66]|nr:hemerythrin domain-containing protein [Streptomyces sp. JJ66]